MSSRDRDYTHCHTCGRRWTGKRECHCTRCHNHFGSESAFDRHQLAGRCLDASEMVDPIREGGPPRLVPTSRQTGVVWVTGKRKDIGSWLTSRKASTT